MTLTPKAQNALKKKEICPGLFVYLFLSPVICLNTTNEGTWKKRKKKKVHETASP